MYYIIKVGEDTYKVSKKEIMSKLIELLGATVEKMDPIEYRKEYYKEHHEKIRDYQSKRRIESKK